jgi:hypothetical protein
VDPRTKPNANLSAALLGCSVEQAKRQFAKNAAQLASMADKATATDRRVNGYTAEELRGMASDYQAASL